MCSNWARAEMTEIWSRSGSRLGKKCRQLSFTHIGFPFVTMIVSPSDMACLRSDSTVRSSC